MLSVYLDGELPSPWREKLESHVSACPACAGRIKAYRSISSARSGEAPGGEGAVGAASERVWQRLGASGGRAARPLPGRAIWRRRVSVPLPAAAAAAIAGMALALALWAPGPEGSARRDARPVTLAAEADLYVPIDDMESVVDYLIARSGSELLVLRLPEYQSFVASGEPAIIRAADYSRQIASWQGRRRP